MERKPVFYKQTWSFVLTHVLVIILTNLFHYLVLYYQQFIITNIKIYALEWAD